MNSLLLLNLAPELEDDMVDYLLSVSSISGFTSYPVRGHGEHSYLSIAEQVSGRRKRVQFEIVLAASDVEALLSGLPEVGSGIKYWELPVSRFGRVE
jgi:hypothetical protein